MKFKISIISFLIVINFINCTKIFTAIDNLEEEERIVIDAFINDVRLPPSSYYTFQSYIDPYYYGVDPPYAKIRTFTANAESVWEKFDSYVKIRKSNSLFTTEDETALITNASVILKCDDGRIDTLREISDPKFIAHNRYNPKGFFRLQNMQPQAGKSYTLTVIYKDKTYQATSYMPKLKNIDSMKIFFHHFNNKFIDYYNKTNKDNTFQPVVYVNKNEPNGFYLCKLARSSFDNNDSLYLKVANSFDWLTNVVDENSQGSNYIDGYAVNSPGGTTNRNIYYPQEYRSRYLGDSIVGAGTLYMYDRLYLQKIYSKFNLDDLSFGDIEIYFGSLSQESYNFFKVLNTLYKSDAGIYTPTPNTPFSNFNNGALGYFYTSSAQVYNLFYPGVDEKYTMDGTEASVLPLVTIGPLGAHYFRKEYMKFDNRNNIDTTVTFPNRRPF
ncbi:MAG: hypothetical protein ORN58_06955 [Sediminibacterium sp.]|nr:hypothetical protein [Sediminibacterium sp.]